MPSQKKRPTASSKRKQKTHNRTVLTIVAGVGILALIGVLAYSTFLYKNSGHEQKGFVVCSPENTTCEESKHIHADIDVSFCGEDIQFPKEKGDTTKQHTHKERNKLHWHAQIPIDPLTKEYIDPTPRMLGAFFEQMERPLPDSCPSNPTPELSVMVNGKLQEEGLEYIWNDGDVIRVRVE